MDDCDEIKCANKGMLSFKTKKLRPDESAEKVSESAEKSAE